ncbi:CarD family transcriptional regulator [Clostridium sp. OM07-9AC]|nr:CarD family transcriptional regulator [Clostridium sp. OM07-9AC]
MKRNLQYEKRENMYQVNDSVVYGTHGVCEVTAVGRLSMSVADRKKKYYTLRPVYQKDSLVYVPVDHIKLPMRLVLGKEEAEKLVEEIPSLETIWIVNEKERESQYKEPSAVGTAGNLCGLLKPFIFTKKSVWIRGKRWQQ